MSGASIRFTETMAGAVMFGEEDAGRGAMAGDEAGNRVRVHLTIEIDDLARFAADANREGRITGWVEWEALGGRLPVERGIFNLLVRVDETDRRRMRYRLWFRDGVGHPVTLAGEKLVGAAGFRVWPDTTTLYVRLVRGHIEAAGDEGAELIASGILRLGPAAFARLLTTFRATGRSRLARVGAIARFDALFAGQLGRAYGPAAWRQVRTVVPAALRRLAPRPPASGGRGDGSS